MSNCQAYCSTKIKEKIYSSLSPYPNEKLSNSKWYWQIVNHLDFFLRSVLVFILSILLLLIKIILVVYTSISSFLFLLYCSLRQIFCNCRKKKLKRSGSGFLDRENTTNKLSLVIDLDNTLIYSSVNKIEKAKNYAIMDNKFYVYKRPHLDNFLSTMSRHCDLIIYTAGTKEYADKVINHIDKNHLISRRYYRHDCLNATNSYYKDVSKFGLDERKVIIIDDIPNCHLTYKNNIIPIKSWDGQDERDDSLLKIRNIMQNFIFSGLPYEVGDVVNSSINNDV